MSGRWFEDFVPGEVFTTPARVIGARDVEAFAALTGDDNPVHRTDTPAAALLEGKPIVHGALVTAVAMGLVAALGLSRGTLVALLEQRFAFRRPVCHGDAVHVVFKVLDTRESKRPDRGIVRYGLKVRNADNETVVEGEWTSMMRRRPLS
jgi:acyl dehydratase